MNVEAAKQDSRDEKMYQYWASGDSEMYNRTAEQYKTGSQVRSAIINGIKAAFKDGDITQAEAESQLQRLGFDDNEVYYQIREWKDPVEGDKTDKNAGYLNFDTAADQAETDDEESKVKYITSSRNDPSRCRLRYGKAQFLLYDCTAQGRRCRRKNQQACISI